MQAGKIQTLTPADAGYPKLLREIHAPPKTLYVKGTLLPEDEAAVAIVGTRSATEYGLSSARRFGEELARCSITVVSGLAEGVDAAAHEGALQAGGRTIAVVGHGLGMVYPPHHKELAERIVQSGCILSEFPMGMQPLRGNFPQRNRIIAGLSLGTLVVEAPARSGALITARHAMEQGREVFALPGLISSRQSEGTHALLKDGAKLTCQLRDILEELAPSLRERLNQFEFGALSNEAKMTREELRVFKAVPVGETAGLEAIARSTSLQPARLLSVLTGLEMKGMVRQSIGRGFTQTNGCG